MQPIVRGGFVDCSGLGPESYHSCSLDIYTHMAAFFISLIHIHPSKTILKTLVHGPEYLPITNMLLKSA